MNKARLSEIMTSLSNYYRKQGVQLALLVNFEHIYFDFADLDDLWLECEDLQSKNVIDKRVDDKRLLFVSSPVPDYPQLTFVYCRDISTIDEFRSEISRFFVILNIIVIVSACVLLFLLL